MSFEDELRTEALRAKANHPGFDRTIDKIVEDFRARQAKGEFEKWDWNMIAEDFHTAVRRKCVRTRPFKSSKRGRK
jgi:hypothetical protein